MNDKFNNQLIIARMMIFAVGFTAMQVIAAETTTSPCKGLEQSVCTTRAECGWTSGYTRKDGAKVAGYCRINGKKASSNKPAENNAVQMKKESPANSPTPTVVTPANKPAAAKVQNR